MLRRTKKATWLTEKHIKESDKDDVEEKLNSIYRT